MLDLLFPPTCILCKQRSNDPGFSHLCRTCRRALPQLPNSRCLRCQMPFAAKQSTPHRCAYCLATRPFDRLMTLGPYVGLLAELIRRLKFQNQLGAATALVQLMTALPDIQEAGLRYDCVIAVPLDKTTLRRRGYNQALLLAYRLSRFFKLPCHRSGLEKNRRTCAQRELKRAERQHNVRGAFRASRSYHGETCLLIDDILTTGATAEACASVLRSAGALHVDVLTAARTV